MPFKIEDKKKNLFTKKPAMSKEFERGSKKNKRKGALQKEIERGK